MISYFWLQSYNPFLNLVIGIIYFIGVTELGNLIIKLFLGNFPNPFRNVATVLLGFLILSSVMTLLSICFWINIWTMYSANAIIFCLFLFSIYQKRSIVYSFKEYVLKISRYNTITFLSTLILILSILPILYYVLLPTTKIDDIHYHMPPAQYIVLEGGYTYPQYYLRNPALMIYSMAQVPIIYLGFPDAFSVISMLFWFVIIYFSTQILKKFDIVIRLLIASILIVGLYSIIQATPSSTVFSSLSTLFLVVLYSERETIIKHSSLNSFCWLWAIAANATAIGKISLVILTVFLSVFVLYDIIRNKNISWHIVFAFLFPTMLFYIPTILWTYAHVGTFWGHIMADIFPYHKFSSEDIKLAKTMSPKNVNETTIRFIKYNLINFSIIKLSAIVLLFFSTIKNKIKVELSLICLFTAMCFQYLGNAFELRYWGSIDSAFLILTLLYARNSWQKQLRKSKIQLTIAISTFPYLFVMYYYVANLNPIPFFDKADKEIFCKNFIPYYSDYQALDKILPKDAVLLFPEGNVNIIYAPRKLYLSTKDIKLDTALYIITSSLITQPQYYNIQGQMHEKGEQVYENRNSLVRTYRTPNQAPKVAVLKVHKLQKAEQ